MILGHVHREFPKRSLYVRVGPALIFFCPPTLTVESLSMIYTFVTMFISDHAQYYFVALTFGSATHFHCTKPSSVYSINLFSAWQCARGGSSHWWSQRRSWWWDVVSLPCRPMVLPSSMATRRGERRRGQWEEWLRGRGGGFKREMVRENRGGSSHARASTTWEKRRVMMGLIKPVSGLVRQSPSVILKLLTN